MLLMLLHCEPSETSQITDLKWGQIKYSFKWQRIISLPLWTPTWFSVHLFFEVIAFNVLLIVFPFLFYSFYFMFSVCLFVCLFLRVRFFSAPLKFGSCQGCEEGGVLFLSFNQKKGGKYCFPIKNIKIPGGPLSYGCWWRQIKKSKGHYGRKKMHSVRNKQTKDRTDFFLKRKKEEETKRRERDGEKRELHFGFFSFSRAENFRERQEKMEKSCLWTEMILLHPSRSFIPSSPLSSCLTWQNITDALWDLREEGKGTQSFINSW